MEEPSFYTYYNGPSQQSQHRPQPQPLHVYSSPGPQFQVQFQRQRSSFSVPPSTPTPTTPVPPWAALQSAPKRVSKLSSLGGGGFDFGTNYSTLPRSRFTRADSYQQGSEWNRQCARPSISDDNSTQQPEPLPLAVGPIPKVCRLRNLGGGGSDYGSSFGLATLPRQASRRRMSQPVQTSSFLRDGGRQEVTPNSWKNQGSHQDYGSVFSYRHEPASSPRYQPQRLDVSREQQLNATTKQESRQENQHDGGELSPILPVRERRKLFQGTPPNMPSGKPTPKYQNSEFAFGNENQRYRQENQSYRQEHQGYRQENQGYRQEHQDYRQEHQANRESSPPPSTRSVTKYPSVDSHFTPSAIGQKTNMTITPNSSFIKFQPTNSFQEKVPNKFSSTFTIKGTQPWQNYSSQWQNDVSQRQSDVSQWSQPPRSQTNSFSAQPNKPAGTQFRSEPTTNFGSNTNVEPRANQFYSFGPEIAATDF